MSGASITILDEDHTFANPLRHIIANLPDTDLCGYSIPHPSDTKVVFRIQTKPGCDRKPVELMKDGCHCLIKQMDELEKIYNASLH
ncbi:RNA polymerase Rpb3/Rpb11 dimerization domain containing protein [Entamoeba marina]